MQKQPLKWQNVKLKFVLSLLLSLGAVLLIGCANPAPLYCPAAVHADDCTINWLNTLHPPSCAQDYFKRVGDQQEAIRENCGV
jgi:hypothetical protein